MFELIYTGFFFLLVLEVILFLFLNLPTPKGWKGKIICFLNQNKSVKNIMRIHLGCCLIAGLFLVDCYQLGNKFKKDKKALKKKDSMASELKSSFLSFMILKVQRNEYITFMLIYTSLALNCYLWLIQYIHKKREIMQGQHQLPVSQNAFINRFSFG